MYFWKSGGIIVDINDSNIHESHRWELWAASVSGDHSDHYCFRLLVIQTGRNCNDSYRRWQETGTWQVWFDFGNRHNGRSIATLRPLSHFISKYKGPQLVATCRTMVQLIGGKCTLKYSIAIISRGENLPAATLARPWSRKKRPTPPINHWWLYKLTINAHGQGIFYCLQFDYQYT